MRVLEFIQRVKLSGIDRDGVYYSQGVATDAIERMTTAEFQLFAEELDKLVAGSEYIAKMSTGHLCVMDDDAGNLFKVTRMHRMFPTLSDEQRQMMAEMLSSKK